MAIKFEKVQDGMTLYTTIKRKLGSTNIKTVEVVPVEVLDIDVEKRKVFIKFRGVERWISEERLRTYSAKKPETRTTITGATYVVTKPRKQKVH